MKKKILIILTIIIILYTIINNELYIIFESASNLYKYYTPYQTDKIHKITLPNEY